jgi:hypothetical protein
MTTIYDIGPGDFVLDQAGCKQKIRAIEAEVDRRSRAQRWREAVAELVSLQDDYRTGLPPNA